MSLSVGGAGSMRAVNARIHLLKSRYATECMRQRIRKEMVRSLGASTVLCILASDGQGYGRHTKRVRLTVRSPDVSQEYL